ncbi:MAG TPA: cytochrome c oxidase subunit 3 [Terriglobia bacterium]|nr:cytochrome c oxidase subunit 3 [Terriglobia bacterium]
MAPDASNRKSTINAGAEPQEASAYGLRVKHLGMAWFIAADAALFFAVFAACLWIRMSSARWPREFPPSPAATAAMTAILFASSLTMALALRAAGRNNSRQALAWLLAAALGAAAFGLLEIRQWMELIARGLTLARDPWGTPALGASFFALTGLHLLHIAAGVIYALVLTASASRHRLTSERVKLCNLYWQYVCILWLFILPFVYLSFGQTRL